MTPYFSIIVPVYNVAPYLREALDSVLAQTFTDWECLCVDDGSTDGSGAILDEYAAKDKRFRVFHKENGGVSSARNLALDNAKGEWICFLDGDDALLPKLLEKLVPFTKADDEVDLVSYSCRYGEHLPFDMASDESVKTETLDLRDWIPSKVPGGGFGEKIYRRGHAPDIRFEPYPIGEDKLYAAEWICRSRKIIWTNIPGYWYRAREGSAVLSKDTLTHIRSSFGAGSQMLKFFSRKIPQIDGRIIRGECVRISEKIALRLAHIPNSSEKAGFIAEWCVALGAHAKLQGLSRWYQFAFRMACQCPFLWRMLFLVPFRLKLLRNKLKG